VIAVTQGHDGVRSMQVMGAEHQRPLGINASEAFGQIFKRARVRKRTAHLVGVSFVAIHQANDLDDASLF
jgi:hypothetical protein